MIGAYERQGWFKAGSGCQDFSNAMLMMLHLMMSNDNYAREKLCICNFTSLLST
jgi:hypothetical protein